ncbi:MAG: YceI family protein [Acidimicrobiia bacterium]
MTTATANATTSTPAVGVWDIDPTHSHLSIIARHLMVTKVRGTFEDISGTIEVAEDPTRSSARVEAKAASVTTGVADRDGHLRSPDFLNAETYPLITFESTAVTPKGDDWKLTGDLTIRGVTKPVSFDLTYEGSGQDPYGNTKAGFVASGEIDREQFGLTWNVPLEGGGVLVSRNFKIEFEVQAKLRS